MMFKIYKSFAVLCMLILLASCSTQRTVNVAEGQQIGAYQVTSYNVVNAGESHPVTFIASVSKKEQQRVEDVLNVMLPVALPKNKGTPVHLEISLRNVNLSTSAVQSLFAGDTATIQSRVRLLDAKNRSKEVGSALVSAFGQGRAGVVGAASSAHVTKDEEFDALMAKYVTTLIYTLYPNTK
jgi:hypothetical protein